MGEEISNNHQECQPVLMINFLASEDWQRCARDSAVQLCGRSSAVPDWLSEVEIAIVFGHWRLGEKSQLSP